MKNKNYVIANIITKLTKKLLAAKNKLESM